MSRNICASTESDMAKLPKIQHVKLVRSKGKTYAYFNTGRKVDGKTVYVSLPPLSSESFWPTYGTLKGNRNKIRSTEYLIRDLIRDYQRSRAFTERAEGTRVLYVKTLRKIEDTLGDWPVNALNREKVEDVLETDMAEKPGAWNIYVAVLGAMYKYARPKRTTNNPTAGIEKRDTKAHEPWPEDVLEAALASPDPLVRLSVHLLYFTGQRIGDVCKMRWGDIRHGYVAVTQQKTGKDVEPLLIAELAEELARTPRRGITILADEAGNPIDRDDLRRVLQDFTAGLGVKTVPHGLRKNAVNALLEAGCTVAEVAAITGQTFQVVEQYAARVNKRKLGKAAILKLEDRRKAK